VIGADCPVLGERDLHLWFCTRGVVTSSDEFKRTVLSRYAGIPPEALRFEQGEHGKPHLVGAAREMQFNLSHSGDWLACAVSGGTPLGVDLELCNPDRVSMRVARRFFREEEFAALERCDGSLLADRFYDFWTLKEAAVKARGEALAPGLSAHGFRLDYPDRESRENGRISVAPSVAPDNAHYFLLDPLSGYRAAVCWLGAAHLPPQVDLYELHVGGEVVRRKVPLRAGTWPR